MTPRPYALLAELTHRCPLHCPYCSNPVQAPSGSELRTGEWIDVIQQAAALGVLQAGLSGGEPLLRPDLPDLIAAARGSGLYTNLITSAVGLHRKWLSELQDAGLDSVQISLQGDEPGVADAVAGAAAHARKLEAAALVREAGLPLSLNFVLHRANLHRLREMLALAERLGAARVELASTQYYGWAALNRAALLPSRAQIALAEETLEEAQQRLADRIEVFYVLPDYHRDRPKPCMQGWGRRYLTVDPVGRVLPCPTASGIPGMIFENVRDQPLDWIWSSSESFTRFRGSDWMPEPCRSCPQKEVDFGGCRCQAALFTGDAAVTDPVCALSPDRPLIDRLVEAAGSQPAGEWVPRTNPLRADAGRPTIKPFCVTAVSRTLASGGGADTLESHP